MGDLSERTELTMWKSGTLQKKSKSKLLSGSKYRKFQEQKESQNGWSIVNGAREEDKENKEYVETKPWKGL